MKENISKKHKLNYPQNKKTNGTTKIIAAITVQLSIKTTHGRMVNWSLFTGGLYSEGQFQRLTIKSNANDENMVSSHIV